jgi:hypothetical protein
MTRAADATRHAPRHVFSDRREAGQAHDDHVLSVAVGAEEVCQHPRHASVRQIDRRLNSWIRRYPDVHVQTVAAGTGMKPSEKQSSAIDLAVVGSADAEEIAGLATPNCHPIVGYPDCSVLVVRH